MSYVLDGKIANQHPIKTFKGEVQCACCGIAFDAPKLKVISIDDRAFITFHYVGTPHFIYESKSGYAVVYCSDYCRRKHNHRFK